GSLGIDLETAVDFTLIDSKAVRIPTMTWGPLHESQYLLGALLLGRSSSGLQGILVIPGLIDADFTGQVQIVVYTLTPPIVIPKGSKIAQLVPLANLTANMTAPANEVTMTRGVRGFGSTGKVACFTLDMKERPVGMVTASQGTDSITFKAMLDTGAGVTIFS
ncbi:POK9 protein, partial [Galbula dea]|nr:POK9 protein [Galbula dea]